MYSFSSYDDLPSKFFDLEDTAYFLLDIESPDDNLIWDIARSSNKIPHLGNLRASLFFGTLEEKLLELDPTLDIQYWVNAMGSSFHVNGKELKTEEDLKKLIETTEED